MIYQIGSYFDPKTAKNRWAVYDHISKVWHFPKRYGQRAAQQLANKLNGNKERK